LNRNDKKYLSDLRRRVRALLLKDNIVFQGTKIKTIFQSTKNKNKNGTP